MRSHTQFGHSLYLVIYSPIIIHLVIKGLRNVFLSCSSTFFEMLLTNWAYKFTHKPQEWGTAALFEKSCELTD